MELHYYCLNIIVVTYCITGHFLGVQIFVIFVSRPISITKKLLKKQTEVEINNVIVLAVSVHMSIRVCVLLNEIVCDSLSAV